MANVLPTVGAQSGNRLAQMLAASAQQNRGLALQAQFGGMDERRRKMDRLFALLQQRGQQRQAERAARGPSGPSRIAQTLLAGTVPGAFLESDRTVSSGYRPNQANSLASGARNAMGVMGGMQDIGLLDMSTETPIWGQGGGS